MTPSTRRSARAVMITSAVAFYGRTNQRGPHEFPHACTRQYRQCLEILAGCDVVSHVYDDMLPAHRFQPNFPCNG
jgi:hypothetical protein